MRYNRPQPMSAALTARSFADLQPLRRALQEAAAQEAERARLRREAEDRKSVV